MVRACVGLAYPAAGSAGCPLVLETISNLVEPLALAHNDIAGRNIMIGERDMDVLERKRLDKVSFPPLYEGSDGNH